MTIQIIITHMGREKHLLECLKSIDLAAGNVGDMVRVLVAHQNCGPVSFSPEHYLLSQSKVTTTEGKFLKSKLINKALLEVGPFDHFIQWDCDLLMNPALLRTVSSKKIDWFVLGGLKVPEKATKYLFERGGSFTSILGEDIVPESTRENEAYAYVGNVCLSKKAISVYKSVTESDTLYDERFCGWGGEDSVLSQTSKVLAQNSLISKEYLHNAFRHMWHEREPDKKDFDKIQYDKNVELMRCLVTNNKNRIAKYIEGRR